MDQRFEDSSEQSVDMAQEIPQQEDFISPGSEWVDRKSGQVIRVLFLPRGWVQWDADGIVGCPRKVFLELFKPAFLMDPNQLFEQAVEARVELLEANRQKNAIAEAHNPVPQGQGVDRRIRAASAKIEASRRRYEDVVMAEARKRFGPEGDDGVTKSYVSRF